MTKHTVSITLEFPKQRIATLLAAGLEGSGISYWGEIVGCEEPAEPIPYLSQALPALALGATRFDFPLCGGALLIAAFEKPDEVLRLDIAAIERGLACFGKLSPRHFGQFLAEREDTVTGDLFVQACLFGELRYG